MFGIGSTELVIILVFGFLLFGPDKLPQMGRTIGRAMRQFRETQEKLTAVVQTEVVDPMAAAAKQPAKTGDPAQGAASAASDEDDDVKIPVAGPARKETFAERRARLAAERAEAEAAKAAAAEGEGAAAAASAEAEAVSVGASVEAGSKGAADAGSAAAASADPSDAAEASVAAGSATAAASAEDPQEAAPLTTEDLYARRPRKRKAAEAPAPAAPADVEAPATPVDSPKGGEQ